MRNWLGLFRKIKDFVDVFFQDVLDDDDVEDVEDDDETLHGIPDVDSRDLSSAEDPVERPPEPRVPEEKRLSPSGSEEDGDSR